MYINTISKWGSNKTDRHDIAEILLKVTLSTIKETNKQNNKSFTDHTKIRIRELTFNFLGSMFFSLKISVDKI
jgi:hypothetical protein